MTPTVSFWLTLGAGGLVIMGGRVKWVLGCWAGLVAVAGRPG